MILLSRPYAYSKLEIEDPEEFKHRRAQFLIYKALQQADSRRRPSWLRVRICKLKVKIGKRMKKLRTTVFLAMSAAKGGVHKQVVGQLKTLRRLFQIREALVTLPPMFS
ncbi:hypothetical protein RJ639_011365 [Escallonia herrerae]|uniref:Uncharacterized protein n=1 Tax=Escallonia herrerae TaxID=1293975 RepID=A0AA88VRC0_9ASTE|nr:hypothetical protein RJ639_011365 [Escallonia herrerae]